MVQALDEQHVVAADASVTVCFAETFEQDLSVEVHPYGRLRRVQHTPPMIGEYQCDKGTYRFNKFDIGAVLYVTYVYRSR